MNRPTVLPQQRREHPEPHESAGRVPGAVLATVAAMIVFGVVYIGLAHVDTPSAWGDGRDIAELRGSRPAAGTKADGAALYAAMCAACHQAQGGGLAGVFPPLAGSEWVLGDERTAAAIVLHGVSGELTVKGIRYRGAMPSFKTQLDDDQLAALLTHLRGQWGNTGAPVNAATVAAVRAETAARAAPFDGDAELKAAR